MIILLFSLALPIILACVYFIHMPKRRPHRDPLPPGPPPIPLIGNLHQIGSATVLHLYLHQLSKKYGPIIHMKLGHVPLLVISSANLAKQVLKNQDSSFCNRPKYLGQQKLSYNNSDIVFSPYNDYCKEMKKITSIHLFSPKRVHSYRPIREEEIARMISQIESFSSNDRVVNLSEMAMALMSSLVCRIAFGKRYEDHGSEVRRFDKLLEEVQAVAVAFYVSDYFPAFGWVDRVTGMIGRLNSVVERMDLFYEELIKEHLDRKGEEGMDDILHVLIQLKLENKVDLGWHNIKALLMDIFVAGTETSSSAIIWTMTALIKAPKVMEKLKNEIRNLIGKKGKVDEDDLTKLPYLKAVVNESLRLYPPGPLLIPRETTKGCLLDGYEIGAKTVVYVNAYAIGRDTEHWENPDGFMPERFLDSNIDAKGQDFGLIPFGSGRRMCPGILMGLLNVELTIANLLYSFDWELPPGVYAHDVDTDPKPGVAVQKKNALLLVPKTYTI